MANPFCLIGTHVTAFQNALRSGQLNPARLQAMDSATRHAEFAKVVGEKNAAPLNAAFESKLLLKNQQAGLIRWIQQSTTPGSPLQRELLARVDRMDQRILNPASLRDFYADLAKQKLGFGVTMQEAGQITQLAQDVALAKQQGAVTGDWMPYGRARVEFRDYVGDLKSAVPQPITAGRVFREVGGFSKSINASFDLSALFNQGVKTLTAHHDIWAKHAVGSVRDAAREIGGTNVMKEIDAGIFAKENARNGRYKTADLAVGTHEETFPPSALAKLPVLGRLYKASETAFAGFLHKVRSDVFDRYIEIAEKNGRDVDDPMFLKSVGKLVNSLTGRGYLGRAEALAEPLNLAFFSPKKIKADIDFLTAHQLQKDVDPFVRKQAAINLGRYIVGTATVLATAKAIGHLSGNDKAVETDPTSSDFGAIRVGDTRFDITGGERSIAVLAARLALGRTKSSVTGKTTEINTGKFGETTAADLVGRYLKNKEAPVAQVIHGRATHRTFEGDSPTIANDLLTLIAPMGVKAVAKNVQDEKMDDATKLAAMIAEGLGVQTNTYHKTKKPVPKKKAPVKKP